MENPIEHYWQVRLARVKEALAANNFEAFVTASAARAKRVVLEEIIPKIGPRTYSWGGSMTFTTSGLYEELKDAKDIQVIDTFDKGATRQEIMERRRQALLVDLFITGTNAVTETGQLVNLDMYGNRIAALTFGPRYVLVLVGRNKIVSSLEEAMARIRHYSAPANAIRLDKKTPCVKSSRCTDCNSPERICNIWCIMEKSFPPGRVKVVLINEDLGL